MKLKMIKLASLLLLCMLTVWLTGCEGATRRDGKIRDDLDAKIADWNENGTFPITDKTVDTTKYLKEWTFNYSTLDLVFDSQTAHPVMSRMVTEALTQEWYKLYPDNQKPRFQLHVYAYKDINNSDAEWGVMHMQKNGIIESHWYATDTM